MQTYRGLKNREDGATKREALGQGSGQCRGEFHQGQVSTIRFALRRGTSEVSEFVARLCAGQNKADILEGNNELCGFRTDTFRREEGCCTIIHIAQTCNTRAIRVRAIRVRAIRARARFRRLLLPPAYKPLPLRTLSNDAAILASDFALAVATGARTFFPADFGTPRGLVKMDERQSGLVIAGG